MKRDPQLEAQFRHIWFVQDLFRTVRQAVHAEDAEWFEANPYKRERLRPYVPGEGDSDSGFVCEPPESLITEIIKTPSGDLVWSYRSLDPIGPNDEHESAPPAAYGEMFRLDLDWNEGEDAA